MSDKEQLLSRPSSGGYYSSPSPDRPLNFWQRVVRVEENAEKVVKHGWVKVVQFIHGREFFAEFLGTFILVTFGNGSIAQAVFSDEKNALISDLAINIGYGLGLMMGVYVAIGITGAHLNPAVTFAMALRGKTSWIKVIPYWLAQMLGAFVSSVVLYGVYIDALNNYDFESNCINSTSVKTPLCTGKIWATYPMPHLSLANGFLDQVFGTFLLVLGIFAICDSQNSDPKPGLKPLLIGLLLWTIGGTFGFNSGYAINPARDFAPRVFTAIAGWGADVFVCSQCNFRHWWWVPIVAPMIGAPIAAFTYWFLIEAHHPPPDQSEELHPTFKPSSVNAPGNR